MRLYKKNAENRKRYFYFKRKVTIIKAELIRAGNMESRKINTVIPIKRRMIMIKAGIMGATGYAGGELARLLLQRDDVEITWYGSKSYVDQKYASVFKNMVQFVDDACMDDNMEALAEQADVIFTATPQGFCASLMNEAVLSKAKVIDLSADYRIKDVAVYEKWYKIEHKTPEYIQEAVYGLPEINREKIKDARLIANPGCYPTCSFCRSTRW